MTPASPSPRAPGQQPDGVRPARPGRAFVWRELREFLAVMALMFVLGAAGYALFLAQLQGAIG